LTRIERSALVNFSATQMFALVNDVESYPQFMPNVVDGKILRRGDDWLEARIDVRFLGQRQSFSTRNQLDSPRSMTLELIEGPFRYLRGEWHFEALAENACKIVFWLELEFANPLMSLTLTKFFEQNASEQVAALCQRAKAVYRKN